MQNIFSHTIEKALGASLLVNPLHLLENVPEHLVSSENPLALGEGNICTFDKKLET